MHTLSSICRLCLLLLVVKTLAQDHRLRTPDSDGHRTRRKPKWSHFFVMHEPRSEEKDNAQGFFYQVGSGPPVINRLRSSPSGFQSQSEGNNMARYNPVLHSPYPNRRKTHQQFGSRTPDSFGARMSNLPNPSLLNKEQAHDSAGGTFNSEMPPDNTQNFESGLPGAPEQQENFPENQPAPLHFEEDTLGDVDSKSGTEVLGAQGVTPSHATLLHQRSREYAGVPDDSSKASPVSVKTRPSFVVGGQTVFRKKKPLPSHLTPIIPPGTNQPEGESSIPDNSDHEREKLRLSIAQHIPTRIRNILPVLDQDNSGRGSSGLGLYGPDSSAVRLLGGNRESQFLGTEIPKSEVASKNDKLEQGGIINVQNGYGKESNHPEGNLNEREKLSEQSGISGWQSQPQLNPQSQEGAPEIFFSDHENRREREPISHNFGKPPYQTQQPNSPHLTPLKYNYLPVSQQHAQTDNGYKPPSLVNFNTNIHLHGGSPASPNADFQQERPKQASHSLSVHPYVLQRPGSEVLQPTLQKDVQTSGDLGGRIPSSQIYLLRPSNGPDLPLVIAGHQNGPYRQDKRQHFAGEANLRTSQTPSHLTAILPVSLGNSKENAGQRVPQNIFISNAKERTPNIEYSDLLLRNQPQDGVAPSANPATNTATHSIRLLLPQQQLPRYSPTDVPSGAQNVVNAPNRFQTHQVNLLPNSHGYVQTQVQLPPLNFRFQLTPVKDDSNGTFGDSSDSQKAQPNFQPIPYQYQFPLQPVPIQGTHQILFPNLQIANVPLGTSTVPSDESLESTTKSIEVQSNLPEKSEPVTVPSVAENAADIGGAFKDQDISNKGIHESTEDHIPVTTITNDETSVDGKSKVLETASLPNDISVEEGATEKDTKEDTAIKFFTPIEDKTMEKSRTESKNADIQLSSSIGHSEDKEEIEVASEDDSKLELTTKSQFSSRKPILDLLSVLTFTEAPKTEDVFTKILSEGTKPVEGKRGTTSADLESSSLSTGDSDDKSTSELSTTVSNAPTTISTRESNTLEQSAGDLDDKGRSELSTTTAKVPTTVSIKESTTLQQSTKDLTDKSSNELSTTVSEVPETTTLKQAAGDLDDKGRSELSTATAKVPTTVSVKESTTLQQSTKDLTDKSNNELSTTVSEAPETTTLEQSAGDLADKSNGELSTTTSKVPTTVSITESTTLEQSTGDLADKSNNELSTRTSEAPTTLGMTESTPLEQTTEDSVDKSRGELSTTASGVPTTISSGESTVLEQDHTSTTEKEVNTDDVSDSSDSPRDIADEDSTVSNTSTTSTVTEHMLSSESPADPSFTTTNVSPSTDATTTTVARINDMSSVSTVAETVRELSETTSTSTTSALQTSTESIPPITVRGTATHSTAETSVPLTEASATTFLEEIMTTTTSTSAETEENNLNADRPLKTELNVSTQISKQEELETVTASVNNSELNQPGTEASQTPTPTGSSSLPDIFSTSATVNASETDAANEIEQFFTSPDAESSTVSFPKIPFTTESSSDKSRVFDKLSVFTFTEAPVSQRKLEKTNGGAKGLTPEENSKGSGTQSDIKEIEQTKKVENGRSDTNVVSTSVTKNSEASLNEIFAVSTTTQGVQDAKDEEGNKRSREGILKEINETSLEPKLKTTKQPDDRAIFTFVGNTVSEATGDKKEIPSGAVTSSTSVSTEDNKVDQFTEKVTETVLDHEIPTSTLNTETESNQNQGRAVGNSDSKNLTSDTAQDFTGVLNGREKNENEVPVVEIGRSSKQNTTEYGSDPEVSTGTEIIVLYDKETKDESENEQNSSATIETQNTTLSSEAPKSNDRGSFVISDSETTVESKSSDSPIFKTTTNDTGNNRVSGSSDSRDVPMIIDNDAMELLLNNLVKPKNISIIEPVTSTSISISIGIPTEIPEQILDEDKAQLPENTLTGQNSDILGTRNTSVTAVQNEDNTNLPASENGSNFFSKVFGKSLFPFNNDNQNTPEDSLSGVKTSEDGSQGVSTLPEEKPRKESTQDNIQDHSVKTSSPLPSTEAPSSFSETQVTSTSISPETEMPISDLSAVKLSVFENFDGKDVPDFTEILKQHAR